MELNDCSSYRTELYNSSFLLENNEAILCSPLQWHYQYSKIFHIYFSSSFLTDCHTSLELFSESARAIACFFNISLMRFT